MIKHTTVLGDLLRYFSRSEFESAVSGYKADFRVRKFSCYDLFKAMIFGLASACFSVRDIEASMNANRNRLYHAGIKEPIKRSTFCDALEKKRNDVFKSAFHALVDKAQGIAGNVKKKFKNPLRIIDASIISLCLSQFNWAKYRKSKGAIKLHMNLDGDCLMPYEACLTVGKVPDVEQMHNLCQETGVIYVMDRGYIDFKSLYVIEKRGSIFVTRSKKNMKYKKVQENTHSEDGLILSDMLIELTGPISKENYPKRLRKVKYLDPETKKQYEFLTNDMERDAEEIAAIYKERWQVELFFKWLKQNLKVKSFWGTSINAVYSQIWVALILSILLWINVALNRINVSAHKLMVMIKSTLLTKNTLDGLCTNSSPPKPMDNFLQPDLEGFKC